MHTRNKIAAEAISNSSPHAPCCRMIAKYSDRFLKPVILPRNITSPFVVAILWFNSISRGSGDGPLSEWLPVFCHQRCIINRKYGRSSNTAYSTSQQCRGCVQMIGGIINDSLSELKMIPDLKMIDLWTNFTRQSLTKCMEQTISSTAVGESFHCFCIQLKPFMWLLQAILYPQHPQVGFAPFVLRVRLAKWVVVVLVIQFIINLTLWTIGFEVLNVWEREVLNVWFRQASVFHACFLRDVQCGHIGWMTQPADGQKRRRRVKRHRRNTIAVPLNPKP